MSGLRDCDIIPFRYPVRKPSAAQPATKAASEDQSKARPVPAKSNRRPLSRRSHLSSDPRVNTARALVQRNRFAEALEILRPLARTIRTRRTCGFSWAWPPAGGPRSRSRGGKRLALLDEAIAAFRSILIHQPGLVRVRLELALAFYLKEEDELARDHFERALVGKPPEALVANINRFLNIMRARRRWTGYFGFSLAPDTNINAASDAEFIYINGLPFRRISGQASSDIGVVGWGGGEYQFPLAALAPAHGVQRQPPGI